MALAGVWHGAGLTFVIFGLLHGVYLTINHAWRLLFHKKSAPEPTGASFWLSRAWKTLLTYSAVVLAQIFFRAPTLTSALAILKNLTGHHLPSPPHSIPVLISPLLIFVFPVVWLAPNVLQVFAACDATLSKPHAPVFHWFQWKPTPAWGAFMALLAALAILSIGGATEFLYFRF